MSLEQIFAKRIQNQTEEKNEMSIEEMLKDKEASEAIKNVLEKEDNEELAIKIAQRDSLNDEDQKKIIEARDKAIAAMNKSKEIFKILEGGELIKNITAISPDMKKLSSMVGTDKIIQLFSRENLTELCIKNPAEFDNLKNKVVAYQKVTEEIKKLDNKILKFSEQYKVAPDEIEEVIENRDPKTKEGKKQALIRKMPYFRLRGETRKVDFVLHHHGAEELGEIIYEYEGFFREISQSLKEIGKVFGDITTSDANTQANLAAEMLGTPKEENFSYNDVTSIVFRKQLINDEFKNYKEAAAQSEGKYTKWESLLPERKEFFKRRFLNERVYQGKRKNTFWNRILEKIINLV